ncbi:MAG TPA: LuxR C-terminal-related transcriptional regulator [Streptomyces sp.]|uniref:helix-turn-helix transcriptional regulator n=1 Tax=Streptomyces sp. TaxID=1931 RepID=UPI002D3D2A64|nr:LuxR C-terminal-related transcriptional regulator [Streptomyces sp.]HZG02857.1 LuxR C-terminal-related transcriptional regulator [Streptomyces sp.]
MHGANAARTAVEELIGGARAGRGGALLVRAEPGLGTTTLLDHAAASFGSGTAGTVLRARGVAAETAVAYSGLHALLRPVAGRLDRDDPRTAALADALTLGAAPADRGPVLAAFQTLLHDLTAGGRPLLVCVDDAHLLDEPSRRALGFAARRLGAPLPAAMLLGTHHDGTEDPLLAGLPQLTLEPLDAPAAAALLDGLLPAETDPAVREALLHEGDGNPGLLTDLAASLTRGQLAGAEPLPHPLPATGPRLRACAADLAELPGDTRTLLLLAAAAHELGGTADCAVLLRAARAAGLDPAAAGPAERRGLLRREGDALRFAHPLLRRAAYWSEPPERRRAAHRLLARALDGNGDGPGAGTGARPGEAEDGAGAPHRLLALRHRAAAATGPDPRLADALAVAARGTAATDERTHAELADALWRAATLTGGGTGGEPGGGTDADVRAARLTAAAEHAWSAGRPHRALALLDQARTPPVHDAVRGRAELVRGTLELRNGVVTDAHEVLTYAARLLGPYDPHTAREALLLATDASWAVGDIAGFRADLARIAELDAAAGDPLVEEYRAGLDAVMCGDFARGTPPLRRAVARAADERRPWRLIRAGIAALVVGDVRAAVDLNTRALAAARARGPAALVPRALEHLAYSELRAGRHSRARAHAEAGLRRARRTGQRNCAAHHHAVLAMAAAVAGDAAACAGHARAAGEDAGPHGLGVAATLAQWALARCDLGRGRPHEAAARLEPLVGSAPGAGRGHFALRALAAPCLVEAAALAGEPETARRALADFAAWTAVTADPLAPVQLARCRALLAGPQEAPALFARVLEQHARADSDFERGRTQLLHGKALRRGRRPGAARGVLRDALLAFERCGAHGWAEQARAELRATGEAAGAAGPRVLGRLTPQQLRIARCVAEGATNREVALRLSVSPRTVDHHLRNVFAALGIRSRVELTRVLAAAGDG